MFIFGEGASLGSQIPNLEGHLRAPLMDNIFDEQYRRYAAQVYVSNSFINQIKTSIDSPARSKTNHRQSSFRQSWFQPYTHEV